MSTEQQETELWIDLMRKRLQYVANRLYALQIEHYLQIIEENFHDKRLVDDCLYNIQMLRIQRQWKNSILN
ncbi:hypothetical protein NIES2100_26940 [Calothrix sp. NIES-2100]|uniref:hypothetical protein n=1 Tax=Calothrix sp. NIES-2100 TaxID=1954172 RepID=UPI000B60833A|nr:hypothetical protein NIES2100_26940 [Calothrix sp. NIES-2100]